MKMLACISRRRKNDSFNLTQSVHSVTPQIASGACHRCTQCSDGRPAGLQKIKGSFSSGEPDRLRWPSVMKTSIFRWTAAGRNDDGQIHQMQEISGDECNCKRPSSAEGRQEKPVVFVEEKESVEWVAQAERGVLITFVSLPDGGNDLIRIRFSRDMFNDRKAEKWWMENREKIMELYNVEKNTTKREAALIPLPTLDPNPEDQNHNNYKNKSSSGSAMKRIVRPNNIEKPPPPHRLNHQPVAAIRDSMHHARSDHVALSSARNPRMLLTAATGSCCRDLESEWVEQDEPGVYITLRASAGGRREIRRIQFRLEELKEKQARQWWKENKLRITKQYNLHM